VTKRIYSRLLSFLTVSLLAFALPALAADEAAVGSAAPNFTLTDSNGQQHSLSDFEGKYVVLEWLNHDCPFVVKHYETGNMQMLQRTVTEDGGVWLSIISSAPGKQGYLTSEEANKLSEEKNAAHTGLLFDPEGTVGKMYGAKTTPHMYIINPEGELIYAGAIDDKPSTRKSDVEGAHNYVMAALTQAKAGEEITNPTTTAYGCSVKYAS